MSFEDPPAVPRRWRFAVMLAAAFVGVVVCAAKFVVPENLASEESIDLRDSGELDEVESIGRKCAEVLRQRQEAGTEACTSPLASPCFDRGRCDARKPLVYVAPLDCDMRPYREQGRAPSTEVLGKHGMALYTAANRSGLLAETQEEACISFWDFLANHSQPRHFGKRCLTQSAAWKGGLNWAVVSAQDQGPWDCALAKDAGRAMLVMSNMPGCALRPGFDVSLPLPTSARLRTGDYAHIPALDRRYFLTFRGSVYDQLRGRLLELHDESNGVVVVLTCKMDPPKRVCVEHPPGSNTPSFSALLNTTFALVPEGRSPGTYRLREVMMAGAIPVFIVRSYAKPVEDSVDWASFSFTFGPNDWGEILPALRQLGPEEVKDMQRRTLEAARQLFGEDDDLYFAMAHDPGEMFEPAAAAALREIVARVQFRPARR